MSGFTRRAKGLELTFPLSGVSIHEPGELGEFVQLVHPLFGPLVRIGGVERQYASVDGAAGAVLIDLVTCPLVPAGLVRVVEVAQASHDDPVARQIRWSVSPTAGSGPEVQIQASDFEGAGAAVPTFANYRLKHSFPLMPGDVLRVRAGVAAGQVISGRAWFIDYAGTDVPWMR